MPRITYTSTMLPLMIEIIKEGTEVVFIQTANALDFINEKVQDVIVSTYETNERPIVVYEEKDHVVIDYKRKMRD